MRGSLQYLLTGLLACLAICQARAPDPSTGSAPTVTLAAGVLKGIRFGSKANEQAFLGVPYAAPPVGALRWKPPFPVIHWTGVRDASEFAAPCPQPRASWLPYLAGNEDCLYLNVWSTQVSARARQPVIVYFHGGSNRLGYAQLNPLGPALARLGVVFVSANYRLGALGFLAHPALSAESKSHSSGNYGLLDQLQVLAWVRDNIARFGGDPARITLMGQSAGAVDICLLMTSPAASGLFERAIMESGDCVSSLTQAIRGPVHNGPTAGTAESVGLRLAQRLGVSEGADPLSKLRGYSADEILKASQASPAIQFGPIVDRWVIPDQPARVFAAGKQLHIPVLVGSNANEATVFGHGGPTTVNEFEAFVREDAGTSWAALLRAYPVQSDSEVPAQYAQLESDGFALGAYETVRAMTRVDRSAYWYYFTFTEPGTRSALGAYHGEELEFLSDAFPTPWLQRPEDRALGLAMRRYWVNFARTSNPNASGLPQWPAFDARKPSVFELGSHIGARPTLRQLALLERIMRRKIANLGAPH